ncbi:MAG: class II fructose-bisphosphate aldolase, partial [Actinomycetota bacterium]|nr:class II fructose-bisphosphate aldolase [Actinomycetota bacterium]
MPLVPMKQVLDEAIKGGYGVGAYNVNNMEQIQGIMRAASETKSPVIIQASRGALKYTNMVYIKHLAAAAVEDNPDIPIVLHLDHGNSLETCKEAIALGFTSVMIDGSLKEDSKTPTTFEENVSVTRSVVEYAHKFGVTVEGELGTLGGIEDGVGSGKVKLTDPDEAEKFVKLTGVD